VRSKHPYQLALIAGDAPDGIDAVADSTVAITPAGDGTRAERVVEGLRRSGVTPADLRARALLVSSLEVDDTLAVYAAVVGFAGRHVDVVTPAGIAAVERITRAGRDAVDAGKPELRYDAVVVGQDPEVAESIRAELAEAAAGRGDESPAEPNVATLDVLRDGTAVSAEDIAVLRWAKRVRLANPSDLGEALTRFAFVAGIRWRRGQERFPALVDGTDLDGIRQEAGALRRSMRAAGTEIAEVVAPTQRQAALSAAASVPIDAVLAALGSVTDGKLWQCPRPGRHTHGDATPSLRVEDNKVCCYVDDAEWVDPLRLVMSALSMGPDEAAALLADMGDPAWGDAARRIVAERAAKSGR
jgi:hypothetical protein